MRTGTGRPPSREYSPTARQQGPPRAAHRRRRGRRPGGADARRVPPTRRAPAGGRLRGLRRLPAAGRPDASGRPAHHSRGRAAAGRPGAAHRPRRHPARSRRGPRRDRCRAPGAAARAHLRALRREGPGPRPARGRAASGPAPGDDLHGHPRGRPASRGLLLRRHRARAAAAGRRGPRHRDGRRARVDRGGEAPAVPRGPRPRRQPPGHTGRPGHGAAALGRRRGPRPDARPAARRRPRQRPALRRRGPHRTRRARGRRHGRRARHGTAQARPADRRGLSRDGPRDRRPGTRPRTAEAGARRGPPRGTRHGYRRRRGRGPMTTTLLRTAGELHARARVGRRAVVMTMGALHEGHATLIRTAREIAGPDGEVVVTVFVNPLQFGAGEDLDRYPRTLDADLKIAEAAGADAVFAPSVEEVYPGGEPQVRISAGPMGERLESASRPGHFDGMLTVVAKLLHLTRPDIALYGQKDAQQLALIRRMVRDLNFGVEIVGVPTVREDDGLALSSRNRYLKPQERRTALALSRALFAGRDRHAAQEALRARAREVPATYARAEALSALGESRAAADAHAVAKALPGTPSTVRAAARLILDDAARQDPPLALDYLALVDPSDFTEIDDDFTGEAVLAVAARVGTTRLIDNIPLTFGAAS